MQLLKIKNIFFCFLIISFSTHIYGQKASKSLFGEYEDTLKYLHNKIVFTQDDDAKLNFSNSFKNILNEVLEFDNSFQYPFDSLKNISRLYSPDKKLRIYNWFLEKENKEIIYYCIVQYYDKRKKEFLTQDLYDNSKNLRNVEKKVLDSENWFGCLYYEIIQEKKNGKQYYTLLGWDGIDEYSTQKIIDVLHFTRNKITFGHPIFIKEKNKNNRVLIEYDERTSVSLSYNKKEKKIIFNNLIPIKKELEGLYEYYVPDGSNNSYNYKSGKWIFEKDIDARNNIKNNNRKKPKMGLLPSR